MSSVRAAASVLLVAAFIRRCDAKAFDMKGACAAIYHEQKWLADDDVHNWDYKIMVEPWTTFGQITVTLHGIGMSLQQVYGGTPTAATHGGRLAPSQIAISLNAVGGGGCEHCVEISGSGQPSDTPTLSCSGLFEPEELSTCDLGVNFKIVSLMRGDGEGTPGSFQAQAKVATWVEPTDVTILFDQPLVLKDVWNSYITDGGVASKRVTLRTKKQAGSWYGDRKSSFGFSADGDISRLPHISCKVTKPMPTPPPPSPPRSPPGNPPHFTASERACFLGGGAIFTTAPNIDPIIGWLRPWTVAVTLGRWIPGTRIVLDFHGKHLEAHPLKILKVDPAEAVHREALTKHSLVVVLLSSPVESFQVIASGAVEGMRDLNCCCDAPPPSPPKPPPPPRRLPHAPPSPPPPPLPPSPPPSPGTHAFTIIGHGRPSPPRPPPQPYQPKAFLGVMNVSSRGTSTIGAALLVSVIAVLVLEVRHLQKKRPKPLMLDGVPVHQVSARGLKEKGQKGKGGAMCGLLKLRSAVCGTESRQQHALIPLEDPDEVSKEDFSEQSVTGEKGEMGEKQSRVRRAANRKSERSKPEAASVGNSHCAKSDANPNAVACVPATIATTSTDDKPRKPRAEKPAKPRVVLQLVTGAFQELQIDMSAIKSMSGLQEAVADACDKSLSEVELQRCGELVMQVVDSSNEARTVTAGMSLSVLLQALELRLVSQSTAAAAAPSTLPVVNADAGAPYLPPVSGRPPQMVARPGEKTSRTRPRDRVGALLKEEAARIASVEDKAEVETAEIEVDELLSSHLSADSKPFHVQKPLPAADPRADAQLHVLTPHDREVVVRAMHKVVQEAAGMNGHTKRNLALD